jgi:hypothetical protein
MKLVNNIGSNDYEIESMEDKKKIFNNSTKIEKYEKLRKHNQMQEMRLKALQETTTLYHPFVSSYSINYGFKESELYQSILDNGYNIQKRIYNLFEKVIRKPYYMFKNRNMKEEKPIFKIKNSSSFKNVYDKS